MVEDRTEETVAAPHWTEEHEPMSGASDLPHFYCNAFSIAFTLSDVCLELGKTGVTEQRLYMSFTTAKSLMMNLQSAFDSFESKTNQKIMIMEEVHSALSSDT